MTELFEIEECKSPRLKWIEKHGVETLHTPHMKEQEGYTWIAWDKSNDPDENGIPDDPECCGYGSTEEDAIVHLAKSRGLRLWNEEGFLSEKAKLPIKKRNVKLPMTDRIKDEAMLDAYMLSRGYEPHEREDAAQALGISTTSVQVGSKVMIIGGYPMQRGLVGIVQRINTAKENWCYVTVGGKIHSCKISDLLIQNTETRQP